MKTEVIKHLPKIELHCHLDGSVSHETLSVIAKKQGIDLPINFREKIIAPKHCSSLDDYLSCFEFILPLLQTKEALELAAYDVIEQAASENTLYIEVRFAPTLHTQKGLSHQEIIEAVLLGLKKGEETFGVKSNALLCGMRHESISNIKEIVTYADYFKNQGVAGFDLAGNEDSYPPILFKEALDLANQLGISLTLHAGECGCGKNVLDAVHLGAKRIGHGIAFKEFVHHFEEIKEANILFEMCPTSNFQTKAAKTLEDYPLRLFLNAGLCICINTDNRTVSNTTLTKEYLNLIEWFDLTYEEMLQLNINATKGAFISQSEKETLQQQLTKTYTVTCGNLNI